MRSLLIDQWQKARRESTRTVTNPFLYLGLVQRLFFLAVGWLRARWQLRRAQSLGRLVIAQGALQLQHAGGALRIGTEVRIWSDIQRTQLIVGPRGRLELGDGCFINGALIAAYASVTIGQGVYLAPMCQITDSRALGWPNAGATDQLAPVVIEDHAWIATRAMVMPGVRIGQGAVVGVGAVVTEDVPPYTVVGGVPAQVLRHIAPKTQQV